MQRFACARNAGFDYVEYLFPYEWSAEEIRLQLEKNELTQILFNLPPGDWSRGERGIACIADRTNEFREGVDIALSYAKILGVPRLNCLAGIPTTDQSDELTRDTLLSNLEYAADSLSRENIQLLIEPINSRVDMPGFYLDTLDKALDIVRTLNHSNLKIQFDIYHMQIMHGDISRKLSSHIDQIAHIQFADNPGRHEPGTGELNFPFLFTLIDDLDYHGYVSAEYLPQTETSSSLSWLQTFN